MTNLYIPFCSLVLCIFLLILFTVKVKNNNKENLYYLIMIFDCAFMTVFCISALYLIYKGYDESIVVLLNKLECFCILNYGTNIVAYLIEFRTNFKRLSLLYYIVNIICLSVILILPSTLNISYDLSYMVSIGPAVDFTTIFASLSASIALIISLLNYKVIKEKIIPVISILIALCLIAILREYKPEFICMEFLITFVTLIMFHTIENPDTKIINELEYSKSLLESSNYYIENNIKKLNREINNVTKDLDKESSLKIQNILKNSIDLINIERSNYKLIINEYNTNYLIDDLKHILNKSTIEVSKKIPLILEGDSNKIKQTLVEIYNYLVNNGCNKINTKIEILNFKKNCILRFKMYFDKENLFRNNTIEEELIKNLIELQKAKFSINYDDNYYIEFSIKQNIINVINKVKSNTKIEYKSLKDKKVLLVISNDQFKKGIENLLNKYDLNIEYATNYEEYNELINNNYDLILLDDMIDDNYKFEFLQLNNEEKYKSLKNINKYDSRLNNLVLLISNTKENEKINYKHIYKPIEEEDLYEIIKELY